MAAESGSEANRKLFVGGLNYNTTSEGLNEYFSKFGSLSDAVVIRFPDTKRSRGFGFAVFDEDDSAETCFKASPHVLDGNEVDVKWATPRDESGGRGKKIKEEDDDGGGGGKEPEFHRKLFVGGLDYNTTSEGLNEYFSQFGELTDAVVLRFHDTKRSRGFGFVTYANSASVDTAQEKRPHQIDGAKIETKRATPKDEYGGGGRGGGGGGGGRGGGGYGPPPERGRRDAGESVKKCFIGGIKDNMSDEDFTSYFSQFGKVTAVEQMTDKSTGRKRGFGFVEFDDYDSVDKLLLEKNHSIHNQRIDVKKAVSRSEMDMTRDGGGDSRDRRGGNSRGGDFGGGRGERPSPWGGAQPTAYGGGGGGGWMSTFSTGVWGGGQQQQQQTNPWAMADNGGSSWEEQGNGGWGSGFSSYGGGGGYNTGEGGGYNTGGGGGYGTGVMGGGMGGPVRTGHVSVANRNAPYNVGGGRGGVVGGGGGGSAAGFNRGGGGGGVAGGAGRRW